MQRDFINNLFTKKTGNQYASVTRILSAARCEVTDTALRVYPVDSGGMSYPIGTNVVINNGRIIGAGRMAANQKIFEV